MAGDRELAAPFAVALAALVVAVTAAASSATPRDGATARGSAGTAPQRFVSHGLSPGISARRRGFMRVDFLVRGRSGVFATAYRQRSAIAAAPGPAERLALRHASPH